jgi:hypothetical protein
MRFLVFCLMLTGLPGFAQANVENKLPSRWAGVFGAVPGEVPGSVRFAGSSTSVSMGGSARLYLIYNDAIPLEYSWGKQRLWVPDIATGVAKESTQSDKTAHARESRLWLRTVTPGALGEIETLIEYDMLKAPGSYTPRLRHAFISVGNLLAGQTSTTFTNTSSIPDIDAATASGSIITRQPMVRWTQPLGDGGMQMLFALEEPASRVTRGNAVGYSSSGAGKIPDIVTKLEWQRDWGNISVAGLARQIVFRQPELGVDERNWSGAVSIAGRIETGVLDNIRFMLNYGNALGRYSTLATFTDSFQNEKGKLSGNTLHSGLLAYQHFWNVRWRSNVALSYSRARYPDFASPELTLESRTANANLVWSPVPSLSIGLEYGYGMRRRNNSDQGEVNRLQFTSRLTF